MRIQAQPSDFVGGKAKNLFELQALGCQVPHFVVIAADELEAQFPNSLEATEILSFIDDFTFDSVFLAEILGQFKGENVAVRSSALVEDGKMHSFAGQFESVLHVNESNLVEALKTVWKSGYSERIFAYKKANNLELSGGIAIVIQAMIDADVAGVGFGFNAVTGDRAQVMISSTYGLGEGLVSGELDADTYLVSRSGKIERQLADKNRKMVRNSEAKAGTVYVEVDENLRNQNSLSDAHLIEIRNLLARLYGHFNAYQDIEFAVKNKELYLLQTRPITTVSIADASGERIIWDSSNIIESYPGITSPLTFSFIQDMYAAVYRQFAGIMGVNDKTIQENSPVFENMLGLLNGRVYYNLLSWYRALAMLPGYALNAEFMEKMMGVKERFELKDLPKRSKFSERMRVLNMVRIMLKNLRQLPKMSRNFQADFNLKMVEYEAIDLNQKSAFELMELYVDFEQTLLKKWKAPLVNDFYAMVYFGVLQKLTTKYQLDESGNLHNDLLCGSEDIISVEPMHRCLKIAKLIKGDSKSHALFTSLVPTEINRRKSELTAEIQHEIDSYLTKFGNRCVGELKLETITYNDNPAAFLKIVQSYVKQDIQEVSTNHSEKLRSEAEQHVAKKLKGKFFKKWLFNYVLKKARTLVSGRENLRFERTRGFGMVRKIFLAIGRQFAAEQLIAEQRDIFYLTKGEIFDVIQGTSVTTDIQALIKLRKEEQTKQADLVTNERITTYGNVHVGNDFTANMQAGITEGDLQGIGCCAGIVRGEVQVVADPTEIEQLNGRILVTSSTDPGWVPLFPTASAILVERGSLLSHSAIVSREMGKPCIVGITGLLATLKTGDVVEMDGTTGVVKRINQEDVG